MTLRRSNALPDHDSSSEEEFLLEAKETRTLPSDQKIIESIEPNISMISDIGNNKSLLVQHPRPRYCLKPPVRKILSSNKLTVAFQKNLTSVNRNYDTCPATSVNNVECLQRNNLLAQCVCNQNYRTKEIECKQPAYSKSNHHYLLVSSNNKCHKQLPHTNGDTNFCCNHKNLIDDGRLSSNLHHFPSAQTDGQLDVESSAKENISDAYSESSDTFSSKNVETCVKKRLSNSKESQRHEKNSTDDSDSVPPQVPVKKRSSKDRTKGHTSSSKSSKKGSKQTVSTPKVSSGEPVVNPASVLPVVNPAPSNPEKNAQVCIPSDQMFDIWEYLKKQDEKLNSIQEQVEILAHRTSTQNGASNLTPDMNLKSPVEGGTCRPTCTEVAPSQGNNPGVNSQIINVLKSYNDQMQKLQEQINMLLIKVSLPNPLMGNDPKFESVLQHGSKPLSLPAESNGELADVIEKVVSQKQTEVTKTSTSTMTSLICEGDDNKVIYQKLTVVTDVSKNTEEIAAHCAYNKNDLVVSDKQSPARDTMPTSRKKCHKHGKYSPCNNPTKKQGSSHSPGTDGKCKCLHQGPKSEKQRKEQHVADLNADNHSKERHNSSSVEKAVPKHSSRRQRKSEQLTTLPKEIKSPPPPKEYQKRHTNKKKASSASSDTSVESKSEDLETDFENSPIRNNPSDSPTLSRCGIPSLSFSIGTKEFLKTYGLYGNRNSSKNARVSLSERYPR